MVFSGPKTGIGHGGFMVAATLMVGNTPAAVGAADVNGDSHADLICANNLDNTLTVLTNLGNGSFGAGTVYPVGDGPAAVVAADVNGDGLVDLISAGQGGNSLTVLTNTGSGGFVYALSLGTGSAPDAVAAADVNGDGRPYLICANQGGGSLTVFTNATTVTAVPSSPVPVANFAGTFAGSGAALTNISPSSITGGVTVNLPVILPGGHTNTLVIVNGIITKIQ